jgi:H+-transporting ATPase
MLGGDVSADQSALTGESLPVDLRESGLLYTGSIIKRGEAKCVVVGTGMNTYFGKTVELVNIAKPKSRQEEIMLTIAKYMMYLSIIAFVIVLVSAVRHDASLLLIATFAVLYIGGGVPAALPVMFTIAQATGATQLAKKGVLVTRLDAIENAASVEVLCLDKTGTITMNDLQVSEVVPFSGFEKEDVLLAASLASKEENKDAIDMAILGYSNSQKISFFGYKQISFTPFDPSTKRTEAIIEYKKRRFKAIKGAPQVVLSLCRKMPQKEKDDATKKVQELSLKGCRALGVARSEDGKPESLQFVGILALSDPLRPDSKSTISEIRESGVRPMMLTGDNFSVAKEIASQAGIGGKIIRISDVNSLPEKEQPAAIDGCDGIAEIYPEDKFRIVKMIQSRGHMAGMTGDGVNDAPALKQAEMGIAVSNATDVAKAAASMVIIEPGTKVIIEAIKTSRQIYQRMLTWAINKITKSIQFLGLLTIGFFWFHDNIVSLSGLMLAVFANDFMTISLATDNASSTNNPNKWNVMNITIASAILGMLLVIQGLISIYVAINYFKMDLDTLRPFMVILLVYTSQFRVLMVRERRHFWSSIPGRDLLITATVTLAAFTLVGALGFVMPAVPLAALAFLFVFSLLFTLLMDIPKYYAFRKLGL